jgi:ABC-type transport system involved in multi-copper enzyme maturation permease subunit
MGMWIMARVTFLEAARRKILWTALIAGVAFLILFGTGVYRQRLGLAERGMPIFVRYQIQNAMLQVGFYAIDMLAVLMTVLTSVDTLSGEIASSTIHAIATKPIARWQVLMGKWIGFVGMAAAYVAVMYGGVLCVSYFIGGVLPHHVLKASSLILFECLLVLTATFLFGTRFSTLTNGVIVLGLHGLAFVGGWIEQIGAVAQLNSLVTIGVVSSLLMPSEAIWRRASFEMQSSISRAMDFSPFASHSAPSVAMMGYAAVYLVVALALAIYQFERRDL